MAIRVRTMAIIAGAAVLAAVVVGGTVASVRFVEPVTVWLGNHGMPFVQWGNAFRSWRMTSRQNEDLRARVGELEMQLEELKDIRAENDLLRAAAGLRERIPLAFIDGNLLSLDMLAGRARASLNRGSRDGVETGSGVITADGILIGIVESVSERTAVVQTVYDPRLEVTARTRAGDTSGIVRGALSDGATLDLVAQGERVAEGDQLVTSGNDRLPAGFFIGTVQHISADATQVFRSIRVRPALDRSLSSRVLILIDR